MQKNLTIDELDKIPEDGIDYRDFILTVAAKNSWVFNLPEYSTAIVYAKKGALGRVSTCLEEMVAEGVLTKSQTPKSYAVTTLGVKIHNAGGYNSILNDKKPVEYKLNTETGGFQLSGADLRFEIDRNKTVYNLIGRIFRADRVAALSAIITAIAVSFQVYYLRVQVSLQRQELSTKRSIQELQDQLEKKENDLKSLSLTIDSLNMELQKRTKK